MNSSVAVFREVVAKSEVNETRIRKLVVGFRETPPFIPLFKMVIVPVLESQLLMK